MHSWGHSLDHALSPGKQCYISACDCSPHYHKTWCNAGNAIIKSAWHGVRFALGCCLPLALRPCAGKRPQLCWGLSFGLVRTCTHTCSSDAPSPPGTYLAITATWCTHNNNRWPGIPQRSTTLTVRKSATKPTTTIHTTPPSAMWLDSAHSSWFCPKRFSQSATTTTVKMSSAAQRPRSISLSTRWGKS